MVIVVGFEFFKKFGDDSFMREIVRIVVKKCCNV